MSKHRNLMTVCFAAVFALGLAACSSSNDDPPAADMTDMTDTSDMTDMTDTSTEPTAPEPTEMEKAQTAAMEAATAAMTAAGNAKTAADDADADRTNAATLQTGETSGDLAGKAREYANAAHKAYMAAKAASEAAAEATDVTSAVRAQVDAEDAQADAEAAETKAVEYGQNSMDAAAAELMIDDTVKRVGDTELDAKAPASKVVAGVGDDEQTTRTGLLDEGMLPTATGDGVAADEGAVTGAQENPATVEVEAVKHVQAVAGRMFPIGKLVDSAGDTARLMIVTQYAGSKSVYVYSLGTVLDSAPTKAGRLSLDDSDPDTTEDVNNVALRSEGTFYRAGADTGDLAHDDTVGTKSEGVEVFSYVDPIAGNQVDREKSYVVLTTYSTTDGTTTYTYTNVDVEVPVAAIGTEKAFETKVKASIPEATDYEHIHFGVWAALGEAAADGSQKIADLGIGFVQNFSDGGLTGADMPNNGSAKYEGNWVATVRVADVDGNGAISLKNGDAKVDANFEMGEITATLEMLATLTGDISGNTFSGTKATVESGNGHSLDSEGKFTGSFSGGFYGTKAAEAGGVFDFTSEDKEAGEFLGAFGADRKPTQ